MIYSNEVDRLKEEAHELAVRTSVVLSLIVSLAAIAILSKRHLTSYLWVTVAALTVPLFLALYFKHHIVSVGSFASVAARPKAQGGPRGSPIPLKIMARAIPAGV
jgi:hypothetical protein